MNPEQFPTSTSKRNIHGKKIMLCIWRDMEGVVYHEFLNPSETVNATICQRQLKRLKDELMQKKNAHRWPVESTENTVRQTLMNLEWEIFPRPSYIPDIAPSGFHSCSVPCNTPW